MCLPHRLSILIPYSTEPIPAHQPAFGKPIFFFRVFRVFRGSQFPDLTAPITAPIKPPVHPSSPLPENSY